MRHIVGLVILFTLGACTYVQKIKTGEMAFERKQYDVAVDMFNEEIGATSNPNARSRKEYLLAESYAILENTDQAAIWYKNAYESGYGSISLLKLSNHLKKLERYDDAIKVIQLLINSEGESASYRAEITNCKQAKAWKEAIDSSVIIKVMTFNSPESDYSPAFFENDQLVFTSDRSNSNDDNKYLWTGRAFSDIFITSELSRNTEVFDRMISSIHNDGSATFSKDFKSVFFTRCTSEGAVDAYCRIYWSSFARNRWSEPKVLSFATEDVNYLHPALTDNDSTLVFSANLPNGSGGYDLFTSHFDGINWSEPINLGERLNSEKDEKFPNFHNDTLYFSSNRLGTMGGYDIYRSYPLGELGWAPVKNIKPPFNSGSDDFGLIVRNDKPTSGYFTSNRPGGIGQDDIYSFEILNQESVDDPIEPSEPTQKEVILYLAISVKENIYADPTDPNSNLISTQIIQNAGILLNQEVELFTNEKGFSLQKLETLDELSLLITKPGYLNHYTQFVPDVNEILKSETIHTYNLEIILDKIFRGVEVNLENIYYDLDKWDIRSDAQPVLLKLAQILKNNPKIKIQLGSHTDCRGELEYNQDLSQKRAQSAVNFLVQNGIDPERLEAVGYGENNLKNQCPCEDCSEDEHQENRRTTFKIL